MSYINGNKIMTNVLVKNPAVLPNLRPIQTGDVLTGKPIYFNKSIDPAALDLSIYVALYSNGAQCGMINSLMGNGSLEITLECNFDDNIIFYDNSNGWDHVVYYFPNDIDIEVGECSYSGGNGRIENMCPLIYVEDNIEVS